MGSHLSAVTNLVLVDGEFLAVVVLIHDLSTDKRTQTRKKERRQRSVHVPAHHERCLKSLDLSQALLESLD